MALAMILSVGIVQAKKALVVVAHGAPSAAWNKPVLAIEPMLQSIDMPGIDYKRVALMEFTSPNIPEVIADCEREHIDTVFVLPLFIAPSSHSEDDIPNILGQKYTPSTLKELAAENAPLVKTNMRIIVGPTLYEGDVIEKSMLREIKNMSKDPANEAVLLLAHGDPERIGFWKSTMKRTTDYVKKNTSINYVDQNLIAMGYYFANDVKPLLERAAKEKKRILVQGIYLMSSVSSMDKATKKEKPDYLKGIKADVVYSTAGILPGSTDLVVDWIKNTTAAWVSSLK